LAVPQYNSCLRPPASSSPPHPQYPVSKHPQATTRFPQHET
jgi:hypothetical protein